MTYSSDEESFRVFRYGTVTVLIGIGGIIAIVITAMFGFRGYGRYQAVQEARNDVKTSQIRANNQITLTNIQVKNQAKRVLIAQQQAQIRLENAKGVREAQDEISKTLTPLYVQFEEIDALKEIAKSGKNSTVVYIPTGTNGLPLVSTAQPK